MAAAVTSEVQSLKIVFNNETRRLSIPVTMGFDQLRSHLQTVFPAFDAAQLSVKYRDDEEQLISVDSEIEWREAFRVAKLTQDILRLHLTSPAASNTVAKASNCCASSLPAQIHFDIQKFAKARARRVALTFDDGPSGFPFETQTQEILDQMRSNSTAASPIVGTFFFLGTRVADTIAPPTPGIIGELMTRGHLVANHGWSHGDLTDRVQFPDDLSVVAEISRTNNAIMDKGAGSCRYFRPAYGNTDDRLATIMTTLGVIPVFWTYDTNDWDANNSALTISNGAYDWISTHDDTIVLMHDGGGDRARTVAALALLLPRLQTLGVQFVTVAELQSQR